MAFSEIITPGYVFIGKPFDQPDIWEIPAPASRDIELQWDGFRQNGEPYFSPAKDTVSTPSQNQVLNLSITH